MSNTLSRNDRCWCGKGRKYKYCHERIDNAAAEQKYQAAQHVYAENWKIDSIYHHRQNDYRWMANLLRPHHPKRIFDVGCGSGHGVVAMFDALDDLQQVVAIDENLSCLEIAKSTLLAKDISATFEPRASTHLIDGHYKREFSNITTKFEGICSLVESDICSDTHLEEKLLSSGKFDAVTIWLVGTHMYRQQDMKVKMDGITNSGDYRLYVQNRAYELANKILCDGGILQVVDRGEHLNSERLRKDTLDAHREQALPTSLRVTNLESKPYKMAQDERTSIGLTLGTSGTAPSHLVPALNSIISIKT